MLPSRRERPRRNENDANAGFADFFGEEVGFCGAGEGHLNLSARLSFDFGFEKEECGDDVCAVDLDYDGELALEEGR